MVITDEICGVLTKEEHPVPKDAMARIEESLQEGREEVLENASLYVDVLSTYNKKSNLLVKTDSILLNCSFEDGISHVKKVAEKMKKKIIQLEAKASQVPHIAYFQKGIGVNPTIGVVEVVPSGVTCRLELTAITMKTGLNKGHSCKVTLNKFIDLWEKQVGPIEE